MVRDSFPGRLDGQERIVFHNFHAQGFCGVGQHGAYGTQPQMPRVLPRISVPPNLDLPFSMRSGTFAPSPTSSFSPDDAFGHFSRSEQHAQDGQFLDAVGVGSRSIDEGVGAVGALGRFPALGRRAAGGTAQGDQAAALVGLGARAPAQDEDMLEHGPFGRPFDQDVGPVESAARLHGQDRGAAHGRVFVAARLLLDLAGEPRAEMVGRHAAHEPGIGLPQGVLPAPECHRSAVLQELGVEAGVLRVKQRPARHLLARRRAPTIRRPG